MTQILAYDNAISDIRSASASNFDGANYTFDGANYTSGESERKMLATAE
jgi:hypothetical protein